MKNGVAGMVAAFGALWLSACTTHFNAVRITSATEDKDVPVAGAPYNLTFTQFDIQVTRQIFCETDGRAKIRFDAQATPAEVRDAMRSYVIDMASLQSFFKSTDVQISYHDNGALKAINASAEDKAGEFVGALAQTAVTIAQAAALPSAAAKAQLSGSLSDDSNNRLERRKKQQAPGGPPNMRCAPRTIEHLERLKAAQKQLEELNEQVTAAAAQLSQYTALVSAFGKRASKEERDEFDRRLRSLSQKWQQQQRLKDTVATLFDAVSVTSKIKWPHDGETLMATAPVIKPLAVETFEGWLADDIDPDYLEKLVTESMVYFRIAGTEPIARHAACGSTCQEPMGLKYRMPASGQLVLCYRIHERKEATGMAVVECDSDAQTVVYKPGPISQLGRIYVLPLKSSLLSTKSISATFSEAGVPTLLGVTRAASSDKASTLLSSLGASAAALYKTRSEMQATDLEAKIKVLKLQKEYAEASKALAPAVTADGKTAADFSASTALANAEVADIEAKKALEGARAVAD